MNERIEKQRAMQIEREKQAEQRQNARSEREKAKEEMMRVRKQKEEKKRMRQEQQEEKRRQVQAEVTEMEEERKRVEMKRTELELESYRLGERIQQLKAAECERPIYLSTVSHQQQQTDENSTTMRQLVDENSELKSRLAMICTVALICDDDACCAFYTGMSWIVFQHVFNFLSPHVSQSNSLSLENEFLFVLMRLRLGLPFDDLGVRFNITVSTASRNFQKWLEVMYWRLKFLIKLPSRDVIKQNMPPAFKQLYPDCICIIDCSEIFITTPSNFSARSATYFNYKKHNTVKFLIGITPCGSISFLSKYWGGRVSDKVLTQESGFLRLIEPGNVIFADRGFTIAEDLTIIGVKLEIPAFTRGKNQLSQKEVEFSKQLSTVRIHVERVIGHLKKKYQILNGPLPVQMLQHAGDQGIANIVTVCAALVNLTNTIV